MTEEAAKAILDQAKSKAEKAKGAGPIKTLFKGVLTARGHLRVSPFCCAYPAKLLPNRTSNATAIQVPTRAGGWDVVRRKFLAMSTGASAKSNNHS